MAPWEREELARFAHEHHVHYSVEPQRADAGPRRGIVGYEVHLFAANEQGLEAPACDRCAALASELRRFAERLVPREAAARIDVPPAEPVLYPSHDVPGADEVALTLRVACPAGAEGDEACLGALRDRLDEVGVPRR